MDEDLRDQSDEAVEKMDYREGEDGSTEETSNDATDPTSVGSAPTDDTDQASSDAIIPVPHEFIDQTSNDVKVQAPNEDIIPAPNEEDIIPAPNDEDIIPAPSDEAIIPAPSDVTDQTAAVEQDSVGQAPNEDAIPLPDDVTSDGEKADELKKRSVDEDEAEGGQEQPPLKKNKTEEEEEEEDVPEGQVEENGREKGAVKKRKRSPELAKFWKTVEDDPSDFSGWTYLLQFVDSHGNLAEGREAFDAFLFKYPYCYGYWKKYSDFEKRQGSKESCVAVFERGVVAIPLSADLWIHYLNYVKAEFAADEAFIRQTYERATKACGREWRSDKLWDHFVKWELSLQENSDPKDFRRVLKLYDEILSNATQGLAPQFDMFRDFVKDHSPIEMLEPSDFLSLRKEILAALSVDDRKEVGDGDDAAPPGVASAVRTDEEILAMKEKIIHARRKVFKETEVKVQARWKFEENIKRPYFHIKPLERGQLNNWSDYIEFQLKEDDPVLAEILFERCLIACALYEEYWIKYTDWMGKRIESAGGDEAEKLIEKTRDIFRRACTHHLPTNVDIHLAWSSFEERLENYDAAVEILDKIEKLHPKLMSLGCRKINAERRRGNYDAVHAIYKDFIDSSKSAGQRSDWSVKYSRFLRLVCADEAKAVKVLEEAVAVDDTNPKLYLQLLDVVLSRSPIDEARVVRIFDDALTVKGLSAKNRLLFAQRKVDFLEDFGSSISELLSARSELSKLLVELKPQVKESEQQSAAANAAKTADANHRQSNGASATSASTPATTTYPATNSSSYSAHHNSQYQQYGARYGYQYPSNYYSGYNY